MSDLSGGHTAKTILIVSINISIALLHMVTGAHYQGPLPLFVNGYMLDILLPFGFYFLLCLVSLRVLRSWQVKGLAIFAAATAVELAQSAGIPIFGSTFDPLDIAMYGLGVILAIICDQLLFPRAFSFWQQERNRAAEEEDHIFSWRQS
jgi:hypothetical protein